jgi:hypothetical protein
VCLASLAAEMMGEPVRVLFAVAAAVACGDRDPAATRTACASVRGAHAAPSTVGIRTSIASMSLRSTRISRDPGSDAHDTTLAA